MTVTLKSMLLDKRRLAAAFRQMTYAEKRHLAMSVADLFEKEIIQEQLEKQRQEKIDALIEAMAKEKNIPVEEVREALAQQAAQAQMKTRQRQAAKPKYRYTDYKGFEHEWSGRGSMPPAMREAIDAGMQLEDFAIPKSRQPRQRRKTE